MRGNGTSEARIDQLRLAETFPAISYVFTGPPNGTIWVRRNLGVNDKLAPTVEVMPAVKDNASRSHLKSTPR